MRLTARRAQAYAWLLLSTLAWGASLPVIKWGLGDTTPFRFLLYRFALASVIAIPIIWYYRKAILRYKTEVLKSIGIELIGTTGALGILYLGLNLTSSLEANLILTTAPIFITLGSIIYLHEKVTYREWFGLGLATSMTMILSWLPFLSMWTMIATGSGNLTGNLLMLVHNFINMTYSLLAKKVYHRLPKIVVVCISAGIGLVSFALLSAWETGFNVALLSTTIQQEGHNPTVLAIAIFAAVVTTFVGLTASLKGLALIEVSEATLFGYLQPAVYIPLGILLLNEHPQSIQIVCFAFVMAGVILAEWKPKRADRKVKTQQHLAIHGKA